MYYSFFWDILILNNSLAFLFQSDDVIVEAESSGSEADLGLEAELADGSENDIKELRARRHALTQELAQQQKRRDKIQVTHTHTHTHTQRSTEVQMPKPCTLTK